MANPVICLQNPTAPEGRQQALLVVTNEARAHKERWMTFPLPPAQLLNEATALVHAERALRAEGIPAPSRQQCLGKLVLPFGQYLNASFHWLVSDDVGFQEMWELYSQYSVQKARPDDFSVSQRDSIQKAYSSVSRWLNTHVTYIMSVQMKRFRKYIYDKKSQMSSSSSKAKHTPSSSTTHTPSSSSKQTPSSSSKAKHTQSAKRSASIPSLKKSSSTPKTSSSISHVPEPLEPLQSDSPVELEGWVRLWENPNGFSPTDLSWVKEATERGLFGPIQVYLDNAGVLKRQRVIKSDRFWFYPPEPPGYISGNVPTPHIFFRCFPLECGNNH